MLGALQEKKIKVHAVPKEGKIRGRAEKRLLIEASTYAIITKRDPKDDLKLPENSTMRRGVSLHLFNKLLRNSSGDGSYYRIYSEGIRKSADFLFVDFGSGKVRAVESGETCAGSSKKQRLSIRVVSTAIRIRYFLEIALKCRSLISILYLWKAFVLDITCNGILRENKEPVLLVIHHWYLVAAGEFVERVYTKRKCFKVCVLHVADHEALDETMRLNKRLNVLDKKQQMYLRLRRLGMKLDCESNCKSMDRVVCFSENDAQMLRSAGIDNVSVTDVSGRLRVSTIPEAQSISYLRERLVKSLARRQYIDVRFLGDLRWYPNMFALSDLDELRRLMEVQLDIKCNVHVGGVVGNVLEKRFPDIIFYGFVDKLDEFLELGDIFMNMVRIGGGVRTKNIAALKNSSLPLFLHSRYRGELPNDRRVNYFNDTLEIIGIIAAALELKGSNWSLYQDTWV